MKEKTLKEYESYLFEEGKSEATILSYSTDVRQFLDYLITQNYAFQGEIPRFAINAYREKIITHNAKPATVNKKVNSLLSFNRFLISTGSMKTLVVHPRKDKIKIANGSQMEVEILQQKEIEKLLFYIQQKESLSLRNKLIIYLLLYTGVRVTELVSIKLNYIDPLARCLTIHHGKGGVTREIPLKAEVLDLIDQYNKIERANSPFKESEYLLVTQRAPKMHRDAVNRMLQQLGRQLNLHLHPHIFRHTFCTQLLKKGVLITTVSKLAGHSNINTTTSYYISTSRDEKQSAVDLL